MSLPVVITVDRASAIRAGRSEFGNITALIDPATLGQAERNTLAECDMFKGRSNTDAGLDLTSNIMPFVHKFTNATGLTGPDYPKLAEVTPEAVLQVLRAFAERKRARQAEKEVLAQLLEKLWQEEQDKWMAQPDDALIVRERYALNVKEPVRYLSVLDFRCNAGDMPLRPEVAARLETLKAEVKRRQETESAAAKVAAEAKAEAERLQQERKEALRAKMVESYCSPEQQRRFAAGLLPEKEIGDTVREHVFGSLSNFRRYHRISKEEVWEVCGVETICGSEPEVEFNANDATTATTEEFATFEAIKTAAAESIPFETECKLRLHLGGLESEDTWSIKRKSVLVTVTMPEAGTFSREYACP